MFIEIVHLFAIYLNLKTFGIRRQQLDVSLITVSSLNTSSFCDWLWNNHINAYILKLFHVNASFYWCCIFGKNYYILSVFTLNTLIFFYLSFGTLVIRTFSYYYIDYQFTKRSAYDDGKYLLTFVSYSWLN